MVPIYYYQYYLFHTVSYTSSLINEHEIILKLCFKGNVTSSATGCQSSSVVEYDEGSIDTTDDSSFEDLSRMPTAGVLQVNTKKKKTKIKQFKK